MADAVKLSIIILTKNEVETIDRCLDCLTQLAPFEVVVIDDNSGDETVKIARKKGARVLQHRKKDFAEARNFGLKNVTGDWMLYVDADEEISLELAEEIRNKLNTEVKEAAFWIPRVNFYLGKRWPYTEKIIRLFRCKSLQKWYGKLHESPIVNGEIGNLTAPLFHHTHRNLIEMVANTNIWSDIESQLRFDSHHPPVSWWRLPRVMLPTFFDYYVRQGGWQIGTVGLIESVYQAFSIFITYAKLWELQQKKQKL